MTETIIQMYNPANYSSWEEAERDDAIHSSVVYMVDNPDSIACSAFMSDIYMAVYAAVKMMDGSAYASVRTVRRAA